MLIDGDSVQSLFDGDGPFFKKTYGTGNRYQRSTELESGRYIQFVLTYKQSLIA